ncbi:MAG: galactokinase [Phycisphaerales bacterium]
MSHHHLHPSVQQLARDAAQQFAKEFGRPAEVVSAAPGRVNLIGEHTDYNGGFVLPMAIHHWCVTAAARADGARGRIVTAKLRESTQYDANARDAAALSAWARYAVGAVWTATDMLGPRAPGAIDAVMLSTVLVGRGLSSSAAVELSAAGAVDALAGNVLGAERLAAAAHEAEHRYAGVPCGWMDQTVCALAEAGKALLIDCRSMQRTPIALPDPAAAIVVVSDSGVKHELVGGEYAARRAACERAAATLGVSLLREADQALLERRGGGGSLTPEARACAHHVISENARVLALIDALKQNDLPAAGKQMAASHASLRDDFRVSCPELDAMVEAACAVPGVFGSRMTGGGFGGCTVTLCAPSALPQLAKTLKSLTAPQAADPFIALPVDGVRAWRL